MRQEMKMEGKERKALGKEEEISGERRGGNDCKGNKAVIDRRLRP